MVFFCTVFSRTSTNLVAYERGYQHLVTVFFNLNGGQPSLYHDGILYSWYPGHGNGEPTVVCATRWI